MYDYIIIGAGSSGCVLASRLSENPSNKVALLEAGSMDDSLFIHMPAGLIVNASRSTDANWSFLTTPQSGLNNREGYQPRGKVLGGSSSINAMVYIRGHKDDYDHWASLGNEGWSWNDVLPYFRRSENQERGEDDLHGVEGPLNVTDLRSPNRVSRAFIDSAIEQGYSENQDFNGHDQEGVGYYQVTQKNGERHSVAKGYLSELKDRKNLTIFTNTQVLEVLFDGNKTTGVRCRRNGREEIFKADREVILSGGAFNSPQLLMLSGIGPADELEKHGITIKSDLPGVGQNLQDHIDYTLAYKSSSRDLIGISIGGAIRITKGVFEYRKKRTGIMTSNLAEAGGFLKTAPELTKPDVQLHFVVGLVDDHGRKFHLGHGFSCHVCVLRPKSTGQLTLASSDPLQPPVIDPGFLTQDDDIKTLRKAYKQVRKILESDSLKAFRGKELYAIDVENEDELEAIIRQRADTVYHPVGTCRMGQDKLAVVDNELKVHGFEGLRVVDASIMPTLIGGNTNAPCVMIGEKAADMILADLTE